MTLSFMSGKLRGLRWSWLLAAGIPALVVYVLTLSRGAYPGTSAAYVAAAAGLTPERLWAHPLWTLLTGWMSLAPVFSLPLRMNLFSALSAAACVCLLGTIWEAWLSERMREWEEGSGQPLTPTETDDGSPDRLSDVVSPPSASALAYDRRAALAARLGGGVAAMAFAFSVPFWSSATRLHFQTFDVLLVLIAVRGLQLHAMAPSLVRAVAVALVCGAGCVESPVFLTLSPIFLAVLVLTRMRAEEPWEWHALACLVAAVAAAGGAAALLWDLRSIAAGESLALRTVLSELARTHLAVLRSALPPHGWIWVLLLVFAPFAAMFLAARRAFGESSGSLFVLHILATVTSGLALFGVPVLFWGAARGAEHFPVMAALTVAATAGYLAAYWNLLGVPRDQPDEDLAESTRWSDRVRAWMGACLGWPLAASVVVAAVLNLGVSNGRNGWFADALAGDVLDRLGGRTWVASDGMLDSHLLILARERRVEIQLVSLSQGKGRDQQRHLERIVDTSSVFAGRRERMRNALALGPLEFLQEWLTTDPVAGSRLAVLGVPEIWTRAGYRAMPDGFVFCGTRELASQRGRDLVGPVRAYWARMARQLAPETGPQSARSRFRGVLRRQAGLAANNLGVVLEDLDRPEEAYEAYAAARQIDPHNLSALLNQHALALAGTHAEARATLERQLRERTASGSAWPSAHTLVRAYGDIRQTGVLARHGLAWSDAGETALARAELNRALSLAPTNTILQNQLANLALRQRNMAESERAYRAILDTHPRDVQAMLGLVSVAMARGRLDEARAWLDRARDAGAAGSALVIPAAMVLAASGRIDEAIDRLRAAIADDPRHVEAWAALADLLLRRQKTGEVEDLVLPALIKAAGSRDYVLVHLVRASLLRTREPIDFAGVRNALLRALKIRPDLWSVRDDLLHLDLLYGTLELRERDATDALRAAPDHPVANYLLATVRLARGELKAAEDLLRRSLAASPSTPAYNDLAETLRRQGRLADAASAARAALARDGKAHIAWDTLGNVLLDGGRVAEAAQAIEQALTLGANDPRLHVSLVRVRLAQGRREEARAILNRNLLHAATLPESLRREVDTLTRQVNSHE